MFDRHEPGIAVLSGHQEAAHGYALVDDIGRIERPVTIRDSI